MAGCPIRQEKTAYPIVTYSWLLCRRKYADPRMAQVLKSVISFGLSQDKPTASNLATYPFPPMSSRRSPMPSAKSHNGSDRVLGKLA